MLVNKLCIVVEAHHLVPTSKNGIDHNLWGVYCEEVQLFLSGGVRKGQKCPKSHQLIWCKVLRTWEYFYCENTQFYCVASRFWTLLVSPARWRWILPNLGDCSVYQRAYTWHITSYCNILDYSEPFRTIFGNIGTIWTSWIFCGKV